MKPLKILITGAVGTGKTTFVEAQSDIDPVLTDVASDETPGKPYTTVGLDYGSATVNEASVQLFGTPGQERFGYMWDVLGQGVDGMVLLVDAASETAVDDTERLLRTLLDTQDAAPYVVGITHADADSAQPEPIRTAEFARRALAVTTLDARNADDGHALLAGLVDEVAPAS